MKIYIHEETGAAYRLKDGEVENHPLDARNTTLDMDSVEWSPLDLFHGEDIPHEGEVYSVPAFAQVIRAKLV